MQSFLLSISTIIFPTLVGYFIILLLDKENPLPFSVKVAIGYGIGLGLVTQWMLFLATINVPLVFSTIFFPLLTFLIFLIFQNIKQPTPPLATTSSKGITINILSIIMIIFILSCIGYAFWRGFSIPLSSWDAFSCNGFKAKAIYFEQSLNLLHNMPHYEYPLHVPFIQVWASNNLGYWHDQFIKIFFPIYLLLFIFCFFYFLQRLTNQTWALFGITLLVSSNLLLFHATISYRDITLMYYVNVSLILLVLWAKEKSNAKLFLSGLVAGFASFVKLDATGYVLVLTLTLLFVLFLKKESTFKKKFKQFLIFTIPCYGILLFYNIFKILVVEPKVPQVVGEKMSFDLYSLKLKIGFELILKFKVVLTKVLENLFLSGNWNIVWLLFLVSLLNLRKKIHSIEIKILLFAMIMFFGIQVSGYSLTQYYYWIADTDTSLSRHLLSHFPIVVALIILLNGQRQDDLKK